MVYLQDAKFPPKRKRKRYLPDILILLESQIFGKLPKISILLFFFFSTIWCCTSMLVHAHDRKIPCSFFLLLPLGSIPVQSLPVREIYCDFYKSEKPRKFLPPARRNILSRSRNWKECDAQFEIFYRNYSCWSNDLKRERDIFFILFFHFWLKN